MSNLLHFLPSLIALNLHFSSPRSKETVSHPKKENEKEKMKVKGIDYGQFFFFLFHFNGRPLIKEHCKDQAGGVLP